MMKIYFFLSIPLLLLYKNGNSQESGNSLNPTKNWKTFKLENKVTFKLPEYFNEYKGLDNDSKFFMRSFSKNSSSPDYDSSIFLFELRKLDRSVQNKTLENLIFKSTKEKDVFLSSIQEMIDQSKSTDFEFIKKYKLQIEEVMNFFYADPDFKNYYTIFYKHIAFNKGYKYPLMFYVYFVPGIDSSYLVSFVCTAYDIDHFSSDISYIKENIIFKGID